MNKDKDILQQLISQAREAKTPEERAWLLTESLLESLSEDLQKAVWAVVVPHWFDEKIIEVLCQELQPKSKQIYQELQELPFVEVFSERGHNIHQATRDMMLEKLWQNKKERFYSLSRITSNYFSDSNDVGEKIEYFYHLSVDNDHSIPSIIWDYYSKLSDSFDYSQIDALTNILFEQVKRNRVPVSTKAIIYYFKVKIEQRVSKDIKALEDLEDYQSALGFCREVGFPLGEANTLKAIEDVEDILKFLEPVEAVPENNNSGLGIIARLRDSMNYTLENIDRTSQRIKDWLRTSVENKLIHPALGIILTLIKSVGETLGNLAEILGNLDKIGEIIKELPIFSPRNKPVRKFWQKFAEKDKVTIILSEYESSPTTELGSTEAIRTAINRHSVSMGNAKAMASLLIFFSKDSRFNFTPNVQGSESREASQSFTGSNLILLGSEISNQVTIKKIKYLRREGAIIPYEVRENQETNIIEIRHITNPEEIYVPQIDEDGSGTDYALIIKSKNPSDFDRGRELIILAGANMYGVEAAARIITEVDQLEEINEEISRNNNGNIWIIIKTEVRLFSPHRATIINLGTFPSIATP